MIARAGSLVLDKGRPPAMRDIQALGLQIIPIAARRGARSIRGSTTQTSRCSAKRHAAVDVADSSRKSQSSKA